jgi:hypothetical protein
MKKLVLNQLDLVHLKWHKLCLILPQLDLRVKIKLIKPIIIIKNRILIIHKMSPKFNFFNSQIIKISQMKLVL